jgi:hypothetical protein
MPEGMQELKTKFADAFGDARTAAGPYSPPKQRNVAPDIAVRSQEDRTAIISSAGVAYQASPPAKISFLMTA